MQIRIPSCVWCVSLTGTQWPVSSAFRALHYLQRHESPGEALSCMVNVDGTWKERICITPDCHAAEQHVYRCSSPSIQREEHTVPLKA